MNGLTYIRIRCNLSQTFLAQKLGVTRQAINLWESRTAPPPAKRLKQLTEFLGIDAKYFGEITEEQCREIDAIPAYRHEEDGRMYFCYVAHPEFCRDPDMKTRLVPSGSDAPAPLISFDERYQIVRQEMRELLEAIDGLTETSRHPMGTIERIAATNRTRHIFAPLVESVRGYVLDETISPAHRMIYYYLLLEVMTSVGLVFGTIDEADLPQTEPRDSLGNLTVFDVHPGFVCRLAAVLKEELEARKGQIPVKPMRKKASQGT